MARSMATRCVATPSPAGGVVTRRGQHVHRRLVRVVPVPLHGAREYDRYIVLSGPAHDHHGFDGRPVRRLDGLKDQDRSTIRRGHHLPGHERGRGHRTLCEQARLGVDGSEAFGNPRTVVTRVPDEVQTTPVLAERRRCGRPVHGDGCAQYPPGVGVDNRNRGGANGRPIAFLPFGEDVDAIVRFDQAGLAGPGEEGEGIKPLPTGGVDHGDRRFVAIECIVGVGNATDEVIPSVGTRHDAENAVAVYGERITKGRKDKASKTRILVVSFS